MPVSSLDLMHVQEKTAAIANSLEKIATLTREKCEADARAQSAELEQSRAQREMLSMRSANKTLQSQVGCL